MGPLLEGGCVGPLVESGCVGPLVEGGCVGPLIESGCVSPLVESGCVGLFAVPSCMGVTFTVDALADPAFVAGPSVCTNQPACRPDQSIYSLALSLTSLILLFFCH